MALQHIKHGDNLFYISRKDWPYKLYFCPLSQYLILKSKDDLTPYVISTFDFDYQWEIID